MYWIYKKNKHIKYVLKIIKKNFVFPIQIFYIEKKNDIIPNIKIIINKNKIKRSIDRNKIKRLINNSFKLNKIKFFKKNYYIIFIYKGFIISSYKKIFIIVNNIFKKFN